MGATIYLKEVAKGGVHRFTLRASDRDLKLRAPEVKTYGEWMAALRHPAHGRRRGVCRGGFLLAPLVLWQCSQLWRRQRRELARSQRVGVRDGEGDVGCDC